MVSILPFKRRRTDFDDEQTRRMGEAFDAACRIMRDRLEINKEMIAKKIIEVALDSGELDPNRLCELALADLGIQTERAIILPSRQR
jgi:hypothetical protein